MQSEFELPEAFAYRLRSTQQKEGAEMVRERDAELRRDSMIACALLNEEQSMLIRARAQETATRLRDVGVSSETIRSVFDAEERVARTLEGAAALIREIAKECKP